MATKTFDDLLKALNEDAAPRQRLLVKADVTQKPAVPKQALGLLLKAAVNDAVASGRLSGTSALAGLRALGLEP